MTSACPFILNRLPTQLENNKITIVRGVEGKVIGFEMSKLSTFGEFFHAFDSIK